MATSKISNFTNRYVIDTQTPKQIFDDIYQGKEYALISTTAQGTKVLTKNNESLIGVGYAVHNNAGFVVYELCVPGIGRIYSGRITFNGEIEYLTRYQGTGTS